MVIPGEQHGILQNQGTDAISPGHFGIAEEVHVTCDPDQLAVVRVAGDVRVAEGDVYGILGDGGRIDGEVGFLVRPLIHAQAEVMPPQFLAGVSIESTVSAAISCRPLPLAEVTNTRSP